MEVVVVGRVLMNEEEFKEEERVWSFIEESE